MSKSKVFLCLSCLIVNQNILKKGPGFSANGPNVDVTPHSQLHLGLDEAGFVMYGFFFCLRFYRTIL